jgi:hypothetical protein
MALGAFRLLEYLTNTQILLPLLSYPVGKKILHESNTPFKGLLLRATTIYKCHFTRHVVNSGQQIDQKDKKNVLEYNNIYVKDY